MRSYLLNLFFKVSSFTFEIKQKIVQAESLVKVIPYAILLIFVEFGFFLISLPLYLLVSPVSLQEEGLVFPTAIKSKEEFHTYTVRRKISLTTILGGGGLWLAKLAFIAIVSFYFLGAQKLLADVQDWTFDVPGDYTYDSAKIEITGGAAQLKDIGVPTAGSTTNSGFDSSATGWTYADWLDPGQATATGAYQSSGGNPGGYVNVSLSATSGSRTVAGYWRQAFTTTVNSPTTATLNMDWKSITFTSPTAPVTYQLYAFIDTASTAPTLGTEVWSSGEITAATAWASISAIDIVSKVPTAGTYYLKFAAYVTTPAPNATYTYVSGFDNVIVNWSKSNTAYDTTDPTITPTSSLSVAKAISWNSFTETATKNGGEIYYQLSSDDGSSWQYWSGSSWASAGATNYNIATDVNTNITAFTTTANQIKWKAFLSSDGTQQVILNNISITYTQNALPNVQSLTASQNTAAGYVYVDYNLQDDNSDTISLTAYEYSLTGAFAGEQATMTAATGDPNHDGISGLTSSPTAVAHTFVWDAMSQLGAVYNTTVYVRLRANDGIGNGSYAISPVFTVDYISSVVSNVSASQTIGTTNIQVTYDLSDNTADNIFVELQASGDGGSTWDIPTTNATGDVGAGVNAGTSKTITWNAGTDYSGQQKSNVQVRVRAKDKYQNQGSYAASSNFSLDTLAPATLVQANLQAQPNAGDTTVLIGGSFTETNPNTNDFYAAINGGAYGSASSGDSNTATPTNKATAVGATLVGHDYISKIKITHTDDYGQAIDNENTSPAVGYKYVKPYTPQAPTLSSPVTTHLDLTVVPHASEASDLEYMIMETTTNQFVQANGTLGVSAVWEVLGTGLGQWGNNTGVSGKVAVSGLSSPLSQYIFKVKSRNPSDTDHAASSESAFSATAQITNTAPSISLNSVNQTTDGTQYVVISYTGTDGQGDISNITTYQYSIDNTIWSTMTEKSGVGSSGVTNLVFLPTSSSYTFAWNSAADLPNIEDSTVYIRLKANDTQTDSTLATSSAFEVDHKLPIVSAITASQDSGARTVTINYTLTDANNSLVELQISSDGGSTWIVPTTNSSGAVGSGVTPGSKTITWNAGTDFDGQYNTNMQVRVRARDTFGNQGSYDNSSNFTIDTHAPVVSNVTAAQNLDANTFIIHYDASEDVGNTSIVLAISSDSGSTWIVPTATALGDVGSGITPGSGKTITWDAAIDYDNQEKTTMQARITATDSFTNNGNNASSDFSVDTKAPRVTNVTAAQTSGSTNVVFNYDIADQNNSLVELDISDDSGSTWTVADTSVSGDVGSGITPGTGKTITWNAGTDFPNQNTSTMRVRIRARDIYSNQSANVESSNFALDTLPPAVNVTADLKAQPLAGETTALIGGSFTEAHPNTNEFYVAIDGGSYGSATNGDVNTAIPSDQATAAGTTLKGNNYISKVKIVHTDDFGQSTTNENVSPNVSYKYVKPYTPAAPTMDNPTVGTVDATINKNSSEVDGLEYAVYEVTQNKYIQNNGTLGASATWQIFGTSSGQWGENTGTSGKVRVNGLANPSYTYQFQVKSRNPNDASHTAASESALSSSASSVNQSPTIVLNSVAQTTDGSKYVTISYTGSDLESETVSLANYQYSLNNSTWFTMTEKSGVGSNGTTGLVFNNSGSTYQFMWDVNTDLPSTEDSTTYIRLRANDGTSNGGYATSSAFATDTKNPVISLVTSSQTLSTQTVAIGYTLTDLSNSNIELNVSSDGGSTWDVSTASASGDIGSNIAPGSGKAISWNAGADFSNQEISNSKTRIRGTDSFGNQGSFAQSSNFVIDTKVPAISNVSASQNSGSSSVAITYDLSDAHSSTIAIDISSDGGSTWDVTDTSVTGAVGSGVTAGTGKTITWNAGTDFSGQEISNMKVRVRGTDTYANASGNAESGIFSLDTKTPTISNVAASQILGSDNFNFTYNLTDSGSVTISLDISSNGGSTWTVAETTAAGDVGSGITAGTGKTITWNAGTDYSNNQNNNMMIRIRGTDGFSNASGNVESAIFSLDTLTPAINVATDLTAQPSAGDTTALIGGSFTEVNPNTNDFYVAINGGAYGSATSGQGSTASPADQATGVGTALVGHDYISKVKIVETDQYGHARTNENTSPSTSLKYVKPYTPNAPIVDNPQNTAADLTVSSHASEASDVEYAIYEVSTNKYVQTNGTLGTSAVWKTLGTGAGQWGVTSGVVGKIAVNGLTSPVAQYSFRVKSRNPNDSLHAASSESNLSAVGAISNTAPSISISSASQQLSGGYVSVNYTGTDAQNDANSLSIFEYSTDNSNWHTMTEKSGVGSNGTTGLAFASAGTAYVFAWDVSVDLPNQENSTVYVRLQSTDTIANSNLATSSAFYVDTVGPVISNISVSQTPSSGIVTIEYNLNDNSGADNNIALVVSSNSGLTYTVPTTTLAGDVGPGITSGTGKMVTWDAGVDFPNQENGTMRVRIQGIDRYGNTGNFFISSDFAVDTDGPVVSGVIASQVAGSDAVTINYTLADITPAGNSVELSISSNSGSTWVVPSTAASGNIGIGQTTGTRTITWNADTDYSGHTSSTMRVRIRATDYFGNLGAYASSSNFSLDTEAPIITSITASQDASARTVTMHYGLDESGTVNMNVSPDGGSTWSVITASTTGDVGTGIASGSGKTAVWDAGADYQNQENSNMRVRFQGIDSFGNTSSFYESSNFTVDTSAPIGLISLSKFSSTDTTATMNWQATTDAHFDHYELWHGAVESDVANRTGTANEWDTSNDSNLSNSLTISTVITGITTTSAYFVKIWAIDDFGNEATVAIVNLVAPAAPSPISTSVAAPAIGTAPSKPILTPLATPTKNTQITVSGLADSGTFIDLYDNGNLFARLNSAANSSGRFDQVFTFDPGSHSLTIKSINSSGTASDFSDPINLVITSEIPMTPIILSPNNNDVITDTNPTLIGVAVANAVISITIDNRTQFATTVDNNGSWSFRLPSSASLANGSHTFIVGSTDAAGNKSLNATLSLTKVEPTLAPAPAAPTTTTPGVPAEVTPIVPTLPGEISVPVPPSTIIREATEAIELAGIPVPKVTAVNTVAANNIFSFTGTSLPNKEVIVYMHSDQALIYRTRTDNNGIWRVNHSQDVAELTPGDHTIYAVTLDTSAKVKSRPSLISSFTVSKNFWVMMFGYLNVQTTVITLIILSLTMLWLYRIRSRKTANI